MMRRTINLLLMLLFVAEVTSANTVDFDKAFKEAPVSKNRLNGPLSRNEHFL